MENNDSFLANSIKELEERYKFKHHLKYGLVLDKTKIPQPYWNLIPYVECFYSKQQKERESLKKRLPKQLIVDFKELLRKYDSALDDWLAGDEALKETFSDEYMAFSILRMYYI